MTRFLGLSISFLTLACATHSVEKYQSISKQYHLEVANIRAQTIAAQPLRQCPNRLKEIERQRWQDIVEWAATCSAKEKWQMVEALGQHLADHHSDAPWGFYFLSLAADARNDLARAFWMLEKANEKDSSLALFSYQRGRLYLKNKEIENAVNEFLKALKVDPTLFEADLFLGQIRLRSGNFQSAENHFRNVLKHDAFQREALIGLARCLVFKGDFVLALDFLDRVISKNKNDYEARIEKAVLLEIYLQKPEAALEEYKALLAGNKNENFVLQKIQQLEKAIKIKQQQVQKRIVTSHMGGEK